MLTHAIRWTNKSHVLYDMLIQTTHTNIIIDSNTRLPVIQTHFVRSIPDSFVHSCTKSLNKISNQTPVFIILPFARCNNKHNHNIPDGTIYTLTQMFWAIFVLGFEVEKRMN
jgi:hypothetical protein